MRVDVKDRQEVPSMQYGEEINPVAVARNVLMLIRLLQTGRHADKAAADLKKGDAKFFGDLLDGKATINFCELTVVARAFGVTTSDLIKQFVKNERATAYFYRTAVAKRRSYFRKLLIDSNRLSAPNKKDSTDIHPLFTRGDGSLGENVVTLLKMYPDIQSSIAVRFPKTKSEVFLNEIKTGTIPVPKALFNALMNSVSARLTGSQRGPHAYRPLIGLMDQM